MPDGSVKYVHVVGHASISAAFGVEVQSVEGCGSSFAVTADAVQGGPSLVRLSVSPD